MHPRRNKKKFQQLTEFVWGRIIGLTEGGFSYYAIGAHVQRNSSTVIQISKQWTDELRTTRKTGKERRKETSASDDRYLLHMVVNDRTASFRHLALRWSTATGVLMTALSIRRRLLHRGLRASVPLYRIPLTANHRWLRLQWAHVHRAWQTDWHQVVFSDESRFNLWNHDGRIRVRRYAGERCLPDYVIERYSDLTLGVKVWGAISYHGLTNLLRIEGIPGAIFEQDNARPRVAKTVRDFCSAQHVQLLPWSAYSPDMSPIEHVGDLVGRRLARDSYLVASKNKLLLRVQVIWNSFPQSRHSKSV
ncbi:transposable element Tcb2 transposase [Trichonephila clavipes]|nr:transposable element Tcb2 transposase [Trichonephila clavipes]